MDCSSAIKRNKILTHTSTPTTLENRLCERTGLHVREISRTGKSMKTDCRWVVYEEQLLRGCEVSFWGDEHVLPLDGGVIVQCIVNTLSATE